MRQFAAIIFFFFVTALAAGEPAAVILNGENGGAAGNLQIAVTLPPALARAPLQAENFTVYVHPRPLSRKEAMTEKHRAGKVFLWHIGEHVFLDVRKLPEFAADGEQGATVALRAAGQQITLPAQGAVRNLPGKTDVVLLIDSSLSMHKNDPERKRIAAAAAFLRLAARDGRVGAAGIVGFNETPKTLLPLTPLEASTGENNAFAAALRQINTQGQTNIGRALLRAADILAGSRRAAIVLLTDGKNESLPYADEHQELARRQIPVYAIGLSEQADQKMLNTIAAATGGQSFWTADSRDLTALYLRIAAAIGRRAAILRRTVVPGDKVEIPVDSSVRELCFLVDDPQASWTLTPPAGAPAADIRDFTADGFGERRVASPAAGIWRLQVGGLSRGREARLTVTAETDFFLDVFPPVLARGGLAAAAVLADGGQAVAGSKVTLWAQDKQITLYDDGAHHDGAAGDGVYANIAMLPNHTAAGTLIAEDAEHIRYRRESVTGGWRYNGEYTLAEQLTVRAAADFGKAMPGREAEAKAVLFFEGAAASEPLRFSSAELTAAGGKKLKIETLKLPRSFRLHPGENILPLRLPVAAGTSSGTYRGTLTARAAGLTLSLPASLEVQAPVLTLPRREFAAGWQRPGTPFSLEIPLSLASLQPLPLKVQCPGAENLTVETGAAQLEPGKTSALSLTCTPAAAAAPGEHTAKIAISAGGLREYINIAYAIAPAGVQTTGLVLGHELVPAIPGETLAEIFPVHEFRPRVMTEELVAAVYQHELRLSYAPPPAAVPSVLEAAPANNGVWIFAAVAGGAVVLLCVRRGVRSRMGRFALLSVILHLPVLGLAAHYLFAPEKNPAPRRPLTAVLVNVPAADSLADKTPEASAPVSGEFAEKAAALEAQVLRTAEAAAPIEIDEEKHVRDLPPPAAPVVAVLSRRPLAEAAPAFAPAPELPAAIAAGTASPLPSAAMSLTRGRPEAMPAAGRPPLPALPQISPAAVKTPEIAAGLPAAVPLPTVPEATPLPEVSGVTCLPLLRRTPDLPAPTPEFAKPPVRSEAGAAVSGVPAAETDMLKGTEISDSPALAQSPAAPLSRNLPTSAAAAAAAVPAPRPAAPAVADAEKISPLAAAAAPKVTVRPAEFAATELPASAALSPLKTVKAAAAKDNQAPVVPAAAADLGKLATAPLLPEKISPAATLTKAPVQPAAGRNAASLPAARPLAAAPEAASLPPSRRPRAVSGKQRPLPSVPAVNVRPSFAGRKPQTAADNSEIAAAPHAGFHSLLLPAAAPAPRRLQKPAAAAPMTAVPVPETVAAMAAPALSDAARENTAALPPVPPALVTLTGSERLPLGDLLPLPAKSAAARIPAPLCNGTAAPELREELPQADLAPLPAVGLRRAGQATSAAAAAGGREVCLAQIGFSVGLAGVASDHGMVMRMLGKLGVQAATVAITEKEMSGCALVLIAEKANFTPFETEQLQRYLERGGKIWFHNCQGFPAALSAGKEIASLAGGGRLPGFAGLAHGGRLLALADSKASRESSLPEVISLFAGRELISAGPETAALEKLACWQDFSAAAADSLPWTAEKWGNPVEISLSDDGLGGRALSLKLNGGTSTRAAVSYTVPDSQGRRMNLQGAAAHYADIFNAGTAPVKLSLALTNQTGFGWDEFETAPVIIRPGWNRNVQFPLTRLRSRRAESSALPNVRRGYLYGLHGAENCARITYYFHTAAPGVFLLDNLRWEKP